MASGWIGAAVTVVLLSLSTLSVLAAGDGSVVGAAGGAASSKVALTKDDVLSWHDGCYFLEGKPFAEISFNKFDLFWQLWDEVRNGNELGSDNAKYQAQDAALKELRSMGMRTIRIFAFPWSGLGFDQVFSDVEQRESVFYKAMDGVLDLCDRNGMKVIYSLGCADFTDKDLVDGKWVLGQEHTRELVANPSSRSRARLYTYLDDVVRRYKDRKTIAMWEITNELTLAADIQPGTRIHEGERMPTLKDVASFYNDVTKHIKAIDSVRMVCNGGSNLREFAWHLYTNKGWTRDSLEEQHKAFELLFAGSALDVMDIHYYQVPQRGYELRGAKGKPFMLDLKGYMEIAAKLGKPFMVGEYGALPELRSNTAVWKVAKDYFESYSEVAAASKWIGLALADVVEAGVPLTYWWCYQSDREMDQGLRNRFDLDMQRDPALLKLFVEANAKLKAKLGMK